MAERLLSVMDVGVRYAAAAALDAVSLTVDRGEIVAVLGPNGAGKTTLMKAIMGLVEIDGGSIALAQTTIDRLSTARRAQLGIGYVPEGRRVFAGMTVDENLVVGSRASSAQRRRLADEMYELFPQLAERRRSIGWQLSGGEQQMLALARALMGEPQLLLADEPSLGLTPRIAAHVLEKLQDIARRGTGVLLCEQNAANARAKCDRAYNLRLGIIVEEEMPDELMESSRLLDGLLSPERP